MGNSEGKKYLSGIDESLIKDEDIQNIFKIYDKNKDGVLQKDEAYSLLQDVLTFYIHKAKDEYKKAKKESGGALTEEEEQKFNNSISVEKNLKEYSVSLFKKMDLDTNGSIDLTEFSLWFKEFSVNKFKLKSDEKSNFLKELEKDQ